MTSNQLVWVTALDILTTIYLQTMLLIVSILPLWCLWVDTV